MLLHHINIEELLNLIRDFAALISMKFVCNSVARIQNMLP